MKREKRKKQGKNSEDGGDEAPKATNINVGGRKEAFVRKRK